QAAYRVQLMLQPVLLLDQRLVQLGQGIVSTDLPMHCWQGPSTSKAGSGLLHCRAGLGSGIDGWLRRYWGGTASQQRCGNQGARKTCCYRHILSPSLQRCHLMKMAVP